MRGHVVGLLALACVTLAGGPAWAQRGRDPGGARYGWLSGLEEGKEVARKTGKPLMVMLRCVP